MKRVGIFSGTFDPVHNGHLQFASDALDRAGLDKVFFLIEPRPRRKQGVKAFEHRLQMVQLAVAGDPALGTIVLEQAQFTPNETLPILKARFEGAALHMLMGDDMLKHLGDWPHVDDLIKDTCFIIGVRHDEHEALSRIKSLEQTRGLSFQYKIFKSTYSAISSSKVKAELRRTGASPSIPDEVQDYIRTHNIYASMGAS
jgi:nicotinate-nucleotide adenylyltransferase